MTNQRHVVAGIWFAVVCVAIGGAIAVASAISDRESDANNEANTDQVEMPDDAAMMAGDAGYSDTGAGYDAMAPDPMAPEPAAEPQSFISKDSVFTEDGAGTLSCLIGRDTATVSWDTASGVAKLSMNGALSEGKVSSNKDNGTRQVSHYVLIQTERDGEAASFEVFDDGNALLRADSGQVKGNCS